MSDTKSSHLIVSDRGSNPYKSQSKLVSFIILIESKVNTKTLSTKANNMQCEFEEKTYENFLNLELGSKLLGSNLPVFSPGQVAEGLLGFDAAMFTTNPNFWRMFSPWWWLSPLLPPRSGLRLEPQLWEDMIHAIDSKQFPKFKCNVLIQYKRPQFISTSRGKEYYFWHQPYFRYNIEPKQQNILEQLDSAVSNRAIVVYACAAFWQYNELFDFNESGILIEHSNFVQPSRLSNHTRYTFINGRDPGEGFSEHVKVPNVSLLEKIDTLLNSNANDLSNSQFIKSLASVINQVMGKADENFRTNYESMLKRFNPPEHQFGHSIAEILSFLLTTNINWLIVCEQAQDGAT